MEVDVVLLNDIGQGSSVESEQNRPKNRSLRNTTGKFDRFRLSTIDNNSLKSIGNVGLEPVKSIVMDSKCVLKAREKNGVIYCIVGYTYVPGFLCQRCM